MGSNPALEDKHVKTKCKVERKRIATQPNDQLRYLTKHLSIFDVQTKDFPSGNEFCRSRSQEYLHGHDECAGRERDAAAAGGRGGGGGGYAAVGGKKKPMFMKWWLVYLHAVSEQAADASDMRIRLEHSRYSRSLWNRRVARQAHGFVPA